MRFKYILETEASRPRERMFHLWKEGGKEGDGKEEREGGKEGKKGKRERGTIQFDLSPQKRYVEVIIPGTQECDLFENRVFADVPSQDEGILN